METFFFYFLAAFVIIPAILVVAMKNVFHSALWLTASLLGVAGVYAMLGADFLFAAQLMVYAGGIMVILIFVVLLSGKPSDWAGRQVNEKAWAAALFSDCHFVHHPLQLVSDSSRGNSQNHHRSLGASFAGQNGDPF